ncbi:MAG TPA: hypothetical protein VHM65_07295, partial [Candidatus Lustribacter sp.]|nr:hypothetical protein [Candidatus Lustribacter sp.]
FCMTRPKPREEDLPTYGPAFDSLCESARLFWTHQSPPRTSADLVVVDLMMQDIRLALRNLTQAAALSRVLQSRIVAIVGPDPEWAREIWQYYDAERLAQLARAYGADEVLDLAALADRCADGSLRELVVAGQRLPLAEHPGADPDRFREIVDATAVRILRVPRVTEPVLVDPRYGAIAARSRQFGRIYEALMGSGVAAFVTSHADYSQWGLGVDAAIRHQVPVVHVQATGDLKSYALFPEDVSGDGTFRTQLTRLIGQHFDTHLWPRRDLLHDACERTAWRAKGNLGRPSWWRGGGAVSKLDIRTPAERTDIRRYAASRLGIDPGKPVVGVFNHAVSDAVSCNIEIFADLADWLTETVQYAAGHPEATWLFLDHPKQANYDGTEHFEHLAERFRGIPHLLFRPSMTLSKNAMWSLVDLAVTVRGSVSNEFPAYGIPAIQAGWSEWSHCGFSMRADSVPQYWHLLASVLGRLCNGEQIISPDQVRRARLWLWAYRCGTDVVSPLVPFWETGQGEALYESVALAMNHIEADGDPVLVSTARMWSRREPLLTRVDLTVP